ncbi:hypothetical protein EDD18DRAFT_207255 [Armillaria luteobubalina]|uniref:Uncharacterized protein n=1 Tax=Armillaria luteobubalina TaxID=153913 RepID=A0AA39Q644_9AGAR|nr:hypothetical protein EDD18DRAFT_207255 [Armillaria luteobubalina]
MAMQFFHGPLDASWEDSNEYNFEDPEYVRLPSSFNDAATDGAEESDKEVVAETSSFPQCMKSTHDPLRDSAWRCVSRKVHSLRCNLQRHVRSATNKPPRTSSGRYISPRSDETEWLGGVARGLQVDLPRIIYRPAVLMLAHTPLSHTLFRALRTVEGLSCIQWTFYHQ